MMMKLSFRPLALVAAGLLLAGAAVAEPKRPECIAPASPGGGFDLTCKLAQSALVEQADACHLHARRRRRGRL